MKRWMVAAGVMFPVVLIPLVVTAHVGAVNPGFANTNQEITFTVGHGCEGSDTQAVRLSLPAGVSSVRPLTSDFGHATVETDVAGAPVAVTWTKRDEDVQASDVYYYRLTVRMRVPNAPFTTVYFPTRQTCRTADGGSLFTDWIATTPQNPDAGMTDEPAPALKVLPARRPGWNRYTIPADMPDLSVYFGDALIVWRGSAAYSSNPNTAAVIPTTSGVTALTSLSANDEVWVKY